jgi:uncharacterized protein
VRSISDSILARVLQGLARFICRRPRGLVLAQLLLAAVCLLYATRALKFDMNRDHLIGPKLRTQQTFLAFEKEFPGEEEDLVVVAESGRRENNRQFIERLAARIKPQTNLFTDLFYKADLTTLGPQGLLLASTNDLEQLLRTVREDRPLMALFSQATNFDSLFNLVNAQFRTAQGASGSEAQSLVRGIPFLQSVVLQAMEAALRMGQPPAPEVEALLAGGGQAAAQQIYVTLDHGRAYLLTVRPKSMALASSAIDRLRQLMAVTRMEVRGARSRRPSACSSAWATRWGGRPWRSGA